MKPTIKGQTYEDTEADQVHIVQGFCGNNGMLFDTVEEVYQFYNSTEIHITVKNEENGYNDLKYCNLLNNERL